ncbi:MAG: flagellar basal body L-ring protein FlgH [Devosia nanyangense]|uniref:Flagellar L-ring protein n=1 Tax=Devosia nanyangense TaxID=1228055 RepID=A0A933NXH8_9HYPH|nr:flagellar basal body L-ring protein FlgH [Devosia nanyangense]
MNVVKLLSTVALVALLAGCATLDQLSRVGEEPKLTAIADPTAQPGYRAVNMPMPEIMPASYQPNSLFSTDARGFFKDQRARKIGDILTVIVTIDDSAQISNATTRQRSAGNAANVGTSIGSLFGTKIPGVDLSGTGGISTGGSMTDGGTGTVDRKETLATNVAVVITQTLPNGNLVIEGHQEVRVNFEIRDLIVQGIVRPEDIQSDNTIPSDKIAEARIAYGGRGQISDVQQPRYGQQIADAILPF